MVTMIEKFLGLKPKKKKGTNKRKSSRTKKRTSTVIKRKQLEVGEGKDS